MLGYFIQNFYRIRSVINILPKKSKHHSIDWQTAINRIKLDPNYSSSTNKLEHLEESYVQVIEYPLIENGLIMHA